MRGELLPCTHNTNLLANTQLPAAAKETAPFEISDALARVGAVPSVYNIQLPAQVRAVASARAPGTLVRGVSMRVFFSFHFFALFLFSPRPPKDGGAERSHADHLLGAWLVGAEHQHGCVARAWQTEMGRPQVCGFRGPKLGFPRAQARIGTCARRCASSYIEGRVVPQVPARAQG